MSDFVSNDLIEIHVFDKKYRIKEMNGKEEDLMTSESMKYDANTENVKIDIGVKNIHYLKTVKEAPYPEFANLDDNGKVEFLQNLKSNIRKELLKQIKKVHSESDVEKK
jgi:hypothetical protein